MRTSTSDPLQLAGALRAEVHRVRPELRVSSVETQMAINQIHTFRERLLAVLASFFAMVALLLAAIGLYGVLDYSVLQRRREIGIRMAIGAQSSHIAWRVTMDVFAMVALGAIAGVWAGVASSRYIGSLLYEVKTTDLAMLALPAVMILAVAVLASVPAVIRAIRIDPVQMLRCE